jgi:large subunit ribosomal protein L23
MKDSSRVIDTVLLTEKGTRLSEEQNKYVLKVAREANKVEIRAAVEDLFGVHVQKVNTMNRGGKKKRSRTMQYGRTAAWKRAVVTLREGETIDLA